MKIIKDYLFTSIVLVIVTGILFPIFTSGDNALVSKAIIQLGWCQENDSACLVSRYLLATLPLLLITVIVDSSINIIKKQLEKKRMEIKLQHKPVIEEERFEKPQDLKWVAVVYDDGDPNYYVTHWAAIRIDNKISCQNLVARLEKVTYTGVDIWGEKPGEVTQELDINRINPTGDDLVWNRDGNRCILGVVHESSADKGSVFVFGNGRKSFPLPSAKFELEISITGKAIKDTKITKTLSVTRSDFPYRDHGGYETGLAWSD